ncbi:MAG: DUF7573 domain-containing protein [Halobacteriota archaeon]|uniref:DUF7573 domain-containing protein n=1 Tax=Natronomonas sp. TaxID=2184060 RepID=UPI003976E1F3
MKDASIDDFLDGGRDKSGGENESEDGCEVDSEVEDEPEGENAATGDDGVTAVGDDEEATEADESTSTGSIDPAVSTYAWSADGSVCADCGDTVERRWRDGDRLVCVDCKAW